MEKYYRFAGVDVAAHIPEQWMYTDERTLEPFRTEKAEDPHHFHFEMVEELSPPAGVLAATMPDYVVYTQQDMQVRYIGAVHGDWSTAYLRAEHCHKKHAVQMKISGYQNGTTAKTLLNAMQMEHLMARAGGFVFHCSYIEREGKAILFTAPSGTGKSTQADLWEKLRGAEIINGDRAAVRVLDESIVAEGIPFAGSSQICKNRTLPLAAVVYLAQAPQTTIRSLRGAEAFRRIWEGVSVNVWDKQDMTLVMDAVQQVVQNVPVYYLACTPDESAVIALDQLLGK